nr:hypothetical protein [Tanacetum cinerariifolium]
MSSIAKFNVKKFDGSNDFGLWRVKMRCLLIKHGWEIALDPFSGIMTDTDKTAVEDGCLQESMKLSEHIDKFNKLIGDLANIDVDIDDEDQALMLLTSLPSSYDNFVETLLYGRETDAKDDGDGLYVKGRSDHQGNQGRGSSRLKSKGKGTYKLKCYICYSEHHLKNDCPKKNKKKSTGFVKKNAGQGSEWIMDSDGSFYMTPRRDFLFDFKEFNGGTVLLGDNRACAIMGIGKVIVQMKDGSCFVLENVSYILDLKRNLISLGTLDREGYTVKLQNGRVKVIKGSLMVLSGTMKGNFVYSLDGWAESGEVSVGIQEKESLAQVWHKRIGHISEAGLHELEKKEVLGNKGLRKLEFYENCVLGKSTREFNNLCKESGISRHLTVAGTPQLNGLAKRMNRTLLSNVRSPSTALEKKTPMDLWSGHPANYAMLRIFGCVAYSHVNQGKLKPRAIKCIFLGILMGAGAADSGKEVEFEVELQGMRDKAKRTTSIPARYRDEANVSFSRPSGSKVDDMAAYAFAIAEEEDTHEPITFQEVINSSDKDEWVRAMKEEMSAQKPRYKARLVDRGFTRRAGIDYNEVFSPVVRHTSIRVILSLTACEDYELEQLDVKMAFLHGNLKETIYMRQPPGFEEEMGNKVCLLKKSLYGLKQSLRQWYKRFDVYMINNGFSRISYNSCVYFKEFAPGMYIYPLLYVDDMLIACKSKSEIEYTKGLLRKEFDKKELGPARKILGMEIVRDRGSRTLKVSQSGYVQKILNNYKVDNGKSVSVPLGAHFKVSLKDCLSSDWDVERMSKVPYANDVHSLVYLMVCTRPNIAYAVSIVSRYLANLGKYHWEAVKWILKYLKCTTDVGLVYGRDQGKHVDIDGFVDADYAKDPDKDRSIIGYVFMAHGCVVSWKETLQHVVALSTTEAEYMTLTEAVKKSIWLQGLLIELGVNLMSVVMNCDNQSVIHLSRNAMFHERRKHINMRYHFIREIVKSKEIKVAKIGTKNNAADAFTKVVPGPKFKYCMEKLGVGIN